MKIQYRRDLWKVIPAEGDAAEIGVAEGYFAANMLQWPIAFPKVYLVDRWQSVPSQKGDGGNSQVWHDHNKEQMLERVKEFIENGRAIILQGDSVEMASQVPDYSLALVNIDADHSYEGVWRDIQAWFPKVMPGGVMAFHDYENPNYGVKAAVQTFAKNINYPVILLPEDKMEDAGAYIPFPTVLPYADSI